MSKGTERLERINKIGIRILLVLGILMAILLLVYFYQSYRYKQITKRENLTLDGFILVTINDELGKSNQDKERFVGSDEINGYKRIFLNMDSQYSNDYQIEKTIAQTMEVLAILAKDREFHDADFKGVSFQWFFAVVDKYGNVSDNVGLILTFDKSEIYKIKWDTITIKGFVEISKTYWVHDLLLK